MTMDRIHDIFAQEHSVITVKSNTNGSQGILFFFSQVGRWVCTYDSCPQGAGDGEVSHFSDVRSSGYSSPRARHSDVV
jgi:hypothetical protein